MVKRADLHLHTRFSRWKHLRIIKPSDSYNEPMDVYRRCKLLGMDFVAITDHDSIDGAMDLLARRPDLAPEVIVGEEVETYLPDTGQWLHVNVFDVDEPIHDEMTRLKGNVFDLVAYLRRRGILHVLNHPFQSYWRQKPAQKYIEEILDLFTHFEVGNAALSVRHNSAVAEMMEYAAGHHAVKHGVGGSDAHNLHDVATYYTEAPLLDDDTGPAGAARSAKSRWLAAVARGECRVVGRSVGAVGLMANVYRIIGRYYLSLREPEVRREMQVKNLVAAAAFVPVCLVGVPAALSLGHSLRLEAATQHVRRAIRRLESEQAVEAVALIEDP